MEMQQYYLSGPERVEIPAYCYALSVYSVCFDDEPIVVVMYEEIEPVKKAA